MVLGSQYLYELREKIYCLTDQLEGDSKGSFFFIENTFYNDKNGRDYSM